MFTFIRSLGSAKAECITITPLYVCLCVGKEGSPEDDPLNKKPVGFVFSSNMHMYYAFDYHIYSFSSMTTNVFLDWQTFLLSDLY